jgi:hypothetical protein
MVTTLEGGPSKYLILSERSKLEGHRLLQLGEDWLASRVFALGDACTGIARIDNTLRAHIDSRPELYERWTDEIDSIEAWLDSALVMTGEPGWGHQIESNSFDHWVQKMKGTLRAFASNVIIANWLRQFYDRTDT